MLSDTRGIQWVATTTQHNEWSIEEAIIPGMWSLSTQKTAYNRTVKAIAIAIHKLYMQCLYRVDERKGRGRRIGRNKAEKVYSSNSYHRQPWSLAVASGTLAPSTCMCALCVCLVDVDSAEWVVSSLLLFVCVMCRAGCGNADTSGVLSLIHSSSFVSLCLIV
jgi:hypothetical protein